MNHGISKYTIPHIVNSMEVIDYFTIRWPVGKNEVEPL